MASQVRKGVRTKTPTLKKRESSQQPPYRKRGGSNNAKILSEIVSDAEELTTESDEEPRVSTPSESSLDKLIIFDALHTAFVDKEKVYTKSYDFALGTWDPAKFDQAATNTVLDDSITNGYIYRLRNKTVTILAQSKKAFENTLDDDDDVKQVNDKIRVFMDSNVKNVRVEYVIKYVKINPPSVGKKHMCDNEDMGTVKKPKVSTFTFT